LSPEIVAAGEERAWELRFDPGRLEAVDNLNVGRREQRY